MKMGWEGSKTKGIYSMPLYNCVCENIIIWSVGVKCKMEERSWVDGNDL